MKAIGDLPLDQDEVDWNKEEKMSVAFSPTELAYQEYLDDVYDLTTLGWEGTSFSRLLKRGDPTSYWAGYHEWVADREHEQQVYGKEGQNA